MKKNSLNREIWKYFLIFSTLILSLLWIFQVIFFDKYYRNAKIQDTKLVANTIKENKDSSNLINIINEASLEKEVCIEIVDDGALSLYSSSYRGKGCLEKSIENIQFKNAFINSNLDSNMYEIINPAYNNDTIVYAIKLEDSTYAFVNSSIEPIDSIVYLIRKELIIISIVVLIFSFIISYYISKHISNPIIKINESAKRLAKQEFDTEFATDSKILELKELSDTLNYTKNELSKTDELRRDLMANVSHDLKTPLTMIKAYAEASIDLHYGNKEKVKQDIDTIIAETERLSNLVTDILTLSKMQAHVEELQVEEFDLVKLIEEILKRYEYLQETENYQFEFLHKKKSILINADQKKIEQVIYNLVNNAIHYTGDDNLVIIQISENENEIKVEIKDTGKGIKEEDLPYIWDKYYKNKKKHKRNLVGTGLGLSIVKQILEAHNFQYGVKSTQNKGTTFYFLIK